MKNEPTIVNFFANIDLINISIISVGEMYFGAVRSSNYQKNLQIYRNFFRYCNILEIKEETARHYSTLKNELRNLGKPIPENDLWIAANALEFDLTIITRDKHLIQTKSLKIIEL